KANGANEKTLKGQKGVLDLMLKLIKQEKDNAAALKAFEKLWPEVAARLTDEQKKGDTVEAMAKKQFENLLSPWFRYFLTHDPLPALRKVTCPVLAINGEFDLQVPPKENLAAIG